MVDRGIVEEWIGKVDEDFGFARVNLEEKKPFFPKSAFIFVRRRRNI